MKKISAIDIGTNSVKHRMFEYDNKSNNLNEISHLRMRYALGLGRDIYSKKHKKIRQKSIRRLGKILKKFEKTINLYDVDYVRACATAAFRQASNQELILDQLSDYSSIPIEIIDGVEEVKLISNLDISQFNPDMNYFIVDVGGGSTEVLLKKKNECIDSKSFPVGALSIHYLGKKGFSKEWSNIVDWLNKFKGIDISQIIGTGGGIRSLFKVKKEKSLPLKEFDLILKKINGLTKSEIIKKYNIRPDRAKLISKSGMIYSNIANELNIKKISVIPWGLVEGIAYSLVKKK